MTAVMRDTALAQSIRIGDRIVGDGCPAFVIAEAGVNHNGSLQRAIEMIDVAAGAGADAVKFQMFRADDLVTQSAPRAEYQRAGSGGSQHAMLRALELDPAQFQRLAERCEARDVEFLATPFGVPQVQALSEIGVPALKLASTDLIDTPLLHAAIETGLPVVMSTGAATEQEIGGAVGLFERLGAAERLVLLHCVSAYPTPPAAANIAAVRTLRRRFGRLSGYSDHTQSLETGGWAVAAGACTIEKHFTLDRTLEGPDHMMSLEPDTLARYIGNIRKAEHVLGDGQLGYRACEADVRTVARKSVVAARPISPGTRIARDALTVKRPGGGIAPSELSGLVGRVARVAIPAETALRWDMVE